MQQVYDSLAQIKNDKENSAFYTAIMVLVVVFALLNILFVTTFGCVIVSGPSMQPTLYTDDVLFMSFNKPCDYGDIIIIDGEKDNGDKLVKRVIALGGDSVKIENGYVYLKKSGENTFTRLEEGYVKANGVTVLKSGDEILEYVKDGVIYIPAGEIFYLGDNRENSSDGRKYGTCTQSQIAGVVTEWSLTLRPLVNWVNKLLS